MKKILDKIIKTIKGPDFRIFIICLCISLLIWTIEKLRQEYSITAEFKIKCTNYSDKYIINDNKTPSAFVSITSDGFNLLRLSRNNNYIDIDINKLKNNISKNGSVIAIAPTTYRKLIIDKLPDHIELQRIISDTLYIPLLTRQNKTVPIKIRANAQLESQHCFSRETLIEPNQVIVSGTNDIIDTMTAIYTKQYNDIILNDTTSIEMQFDLPQGVETNVSNVNVTYFIEAYTEKTLNVPITAINVPAGYTFKAFPTSAHVTFSVGLSKFEKIGISNFDIIADLSDIKPGTPQSKIKLKLAAIPDGISNISYSPISIEYLLERNHEVQK